MQPLIEGYFGRYKTLGSGTHAIELLIKRVGNRST